MPTASELHGSMLSLVSDYDLELRSVTRDRDDLKQRLRDMHQWVCTADNCKLDGGEEHEEYFKAGGLTCHERFQIEEADHVG